SEVPVWVRFSGADGFGVSDIASFTVAAPDGRTVPLLSMVNVNVEPSATQISRNNRQTTLTILANLAGETTVPEARKAMEETLGAGALPAGQTSILQGRPLL